MQALFDFLPAEKKKLDDVGQKIGGARKDFWRQRGYLIESDLAEMAPAERASVVRKANVWRPDYQGMIAAGAEPLAAAFVKVVYDRVAAAPADDPTTYLRAVEKVREAMAPAKTVEEVRAAIRVLNDSLHHRELLALNPRGDDSLQYFGRFTYDGERRAKQLLETGWPSPEPWRARYRVRHRWDDKWYVFDRKTRSTYPGGVATKEEAAAVAAALFAAAGPDDKSPTGLPHRPHLDHLERQGPDVRQGRDVRPEDFMEAFGFRGVEFGLWAAQDERQKSVNLAYEALHDLADALGLPARAISFDGRLALAFGARGAGKAAAHYEPLRQVINLTKLRGAGTLAHEWFHALDHYCGEYDRPDAYGGRARYVSGGDSRPSSWNAIPWGLPPDVRVAWTRVMDRMYTKRVRPEEVESHYQREIARLEGWRRLYQGKLKERPGHAGMRFHLAATEARLQVVADTIARYREDPELAKGVAITPKESDYARQARRLSGASRGARSALGYWARPTEMLARAGEAWVFDKLRAMGRQNDYLVHGVEEGRFAACPRGNPYPGGQEREDLGAALQGLAVELGRSRLWERPAPEPQQARDMAGVVSALDRSSGLER